MRQRREGMLKTGMRRRFAGAFVLLCAFLTLPANAALLPANFFDRVPEPGTGRAAIEADYLSQDANGIVTASGQVDMAYLGYYATADRLIFNQRTNDVELIGNVVIRDPNETEYSADQITVTGNFKKAILQSMVMITKDGAIVTSSATDHDQAGVTILDSGTYSPCGTCIDSKGRRIGWRVRTERMVYDQNEEVVDLEQPILEVLGVPVAWLPWMRLPDPSNPRAKGFRLPNYGYSDKIGLKLEFPYFQAFGDDIDLTVIPTLVSRQGGLLNATIDQRFGNWGEYSVTASGLYQMDRGAFAGTVGDRDWRGAIQTSTRFTPTENWTLGTDYSILSDRAYLGDYLLATRKSSINQAYATYLTPETYGDLRIQEFTVLGDAVQADQDEQGLNLPLGRIEHVQDLGPDAGQVNVSANFQNVHRVADSTVTANGVPYVLGYAGNKSHGMVEAAWTKQWATSAGVLLTPYLGMRADFAHYDGGSALNPVSSDLFAATPLAAIDMRYPVVAIDGGSTHIIEPIAQLVYRGSNTTKTGITNDNAQSFVFDDANIFSYNRFSGTDRQETGLRANVGLHYLADFEDGSYLDFVLGQSFHLGGVNALGVNDAAQTGASTGLGGNNSHIVAGVRGALNTHMKFGAKATLDPATATIVRGAIAGNFSYAGWELGLDYAYAAPDAALGAVKTQQDIGGSVRIPLHDYWYAKAAAGWDITNQTLLDLSASLTYDDNFFSVTGSYSETGALIFNPATASYKLTFKLKGPDGGSYGF